MGWDIRFLKFRTEPVVFYLHTFLVLLYVTFREMSVFLCKYVIFIDKKRFIKCSETIQSWAPVPGKAAFFNNKNINTLQIEYTFT